MTATIESTEQPAAVGNHDKGIKKVWTDTRGQVEKIWTDAFGQLNTRFQEAEKDVLDFVKKVEADGKKRLDALLENLKLTGEHGIIERLKAKDLLAGKTPEELIAAGVRFGSETVEKLGLAAAADLQKLNDEVVDLVSKLENLRKKVSTGPTKKSVDDLEARVAKLEKGAN